MLRKITDEHEGRAHSEMSAFILCQAVPLSGRFGKRWEDENRGKPDPEFL